MVNILGYCGESFNSLGPIFIDCGFFASLWGCILWMLWFLVSVRKLNLSKFVFVYDVKSWGRANHKN